MAEALAQPYLQNALLAGVVVACAAPVVGYFIVLRGMAFAAHALAQIGFAGAAGAVLLGVDPLLGLVAFAFGGALAIGRLSDGSHRTDVTTALILAAALGTGALFLALDASFATEAFTLLFGTIVGVSRGQALETLAIAATALAGLAIIARPLLFATVSEDAARARGVRAGALGMAFLAVVAAIAAVAVPTVGTLLIYSLLVAPAAAAAHVTRRPLATIALAVALAELATVGGIAAAYATGWPVGFFIASFVALEYLAARVAGGALDARRPRRGAGRTAAAA